MLGQLADGVLRLTAGSADASCSLRSLVGLVITLNHASFSASPLTVPQKSRMEDDDLIISSSMSVIHNIDTENASHYQQPTQS